jgi:hypothetical protein
MKMNVSEMNFRHSYNVLESSDVLAVIHELMTVDDNAGTHIIENDHSSIRKEKSSSLSIDPIIFENLSFGKVVALISTLIVVVVLLTVIILSKQSGLCRCFAWLATCCFRRKYNGKNQSRKGEQARERLLVGSEFLKNTQIMVLGEQPKPETITGLNKQIILQKRNGIPITTVCSSSRSSPMSAITSYDPPDGRTYNML